jgi:hypothetical protein
VGVAHGLPLDKGLDADGNYTEGVALVLLLFSLMYFLFVFEDGDFSFCLLRQALSHS